MIQLIVVIVLVLLFIWIQLKVYVHCWKKNLEVELEFETTDIFEGEEGCLKEIIINDKWLPLPLLNVKFQTSRHLVFKESMATQKTDQYYRNDVFCIGSHEKITRHLAFSADKRGCHHIKAIDLVAGDLFMLTTVRLTRKAEQYVYVYPRPYYDPEILHSLQMVNGLLNTRRQFLEDPFEYRGIREYQPYDDMKSINWKATARTGDFKVNLRDFTAVKTVRVFLNLEDEGIYKKSTAAEAAIRLAAGITRYFASKNVRVECYGNCKDSRTGKILYHNSDGNLSEIYRSLACIDLEMEMQSFEKQLDNRLFQLKNGEFTFIISINAYDGFLHLLQRFSVISEDFLWFFPMDSKQTPDIPRRLQKFYKPVNINCIN